MIFADDLEKIFGKRPWVSRSQEIMAQEEGQGATPPPYQPEQPELSDQSDQSDQSDSTTKKEEES